MCRATPPGAVAEHVVRHVPHGTVRGLRPCSGLNGFIRRRINTTVATSALTPHTGSTQTQTHTANREQPFTTQAAQHTAGTNECFASMASSLVSAAARTWRTSTDFRAGVNTPEYRRDCASADCWAAALRRSLLLMLIRENVAEMSRDLMRRSRGVSQPKLGEWFTYSRGAGVSWGVPDARA